MGSFDLKNLLFKSYVQFVLFPSNNTQGNQIGLMLSLEVRELKRLMFVPTHLLLNPNSNGF